MKTIIIISLSIILICIMECEKDLSPIKNNDSKHDTTPHKLTYYNDFLFKINDFHIPIDSSGAIGEATLYNLSEPVGFNEDYIRIIYLAGLWVGAYINSEAHANLIWTGSYRFGNYIARCDSERTGVFFIDPEILAKEDFSPLIPYGFPTNQQNRPILFGDKMCWSALETDTSANLEVYQSPIPNLRVAQALYGYLTDDLDQIFFLRYEIENRGSYGYDEVYAGFFSDTDLLYFDNATGYDSSRSLSYTYTPGDSNFSPSPPMLPDSPFWKPPWKIIFLSVWVAIE